MGKLSNFFDKLGESFAFLEIIITRINCGIEFWSKSVPESCLNRSESYDRLILSQNNWKIYCYELLFWVQLIYSILTCIRIVSTRSESSLH